MSSGHILILFLPQGNPQVATTMSTLSYFPLLSMILVKGEVSSKLKFERLYKAECLNCLSLS